MAAIIFISSCTAGKTASSVNPAPHFILSREDSPSHSNISQGLTSAAVHGSSSVKLNNDYRQREIVQYMLDLINADRRTEGLEPVTLGNNPAAQVHAQDMLDNYYISHWGTDGLKPYMRYTKNGGINYEQENNAYHGWYDYQKDLSTYAACDFKETLYTLEYDMMNNDGPSDGHRKNILNKLHKRVNLGIVYDSKRLALVQQFEGDYIEFTQPPALKGVFFTVSGRLLEGRLKDIQIHFDEPPRLLSQNELLIEFHGSYSLGNEVGFIVAPPPPGVYYSGLSG
jgi:uncharacterized protein YkwD